MNKMLFIPSMQERVWGWRYLAFQNVFLPWLIALVALSLRLQLTAAGQNFLFFCVNFLAVTLIFRRFLLDSVEHAAKKLPKIFLVSIVFFCLVQLSSSVASLLFRQLDPGFANINDQSIAAMSQDSFLLMAIGTVVLVPVAEECLHRGTVFASLYKRNKIAAYAVSASLFALIHIAAYFGSHEPLTLLLCFLQYIPAGLLLAAAYQLTGCIFTPILIHTAVNAMGIFAMR